MEDEEPEIRPLPRPPRCRGIPIGDGDYTGCAYGYGDMPPFTGPRDCPVCEASGIEPEAAVATTLPHSCFGDPDCCGCLNGAIRGDQALIVCNECNFIVRAVPAAELRKTLAEMELTLEMCTEMCPHCRSVNVLPGFSKVTAFTCKHCGEAVGLSDDPNIDFLGKPDRA
jgi:hypothetical protein